MSIAVTKPRSMGRPLRGRPMLLGLVFNYAELLSVAKDMIFRRNPTIIQEQTDLNPLHR
jgi:hypothetical protein